MLAYGTTMTPIENVIIPFTAKVDAISLVSTIASTHVATTIRDHAIISATVRVRREASIALGSWSLIFGGLVDECHVQSALGCSNRLGKRQTYN